MPFRGLWRRQRVQGEILADSSGLEGVEGKIRACYSLFKFINNRNSCDISDLSV